MDADRAPQLKAIVRLLLTVREDARVKRSSRSVLCVEKKFEMPRLTFRLSVVPLTLALTVTAASLWFIYRHRASVASNVEVNAPSQAPVKQERKYERGPAGLATTGSFITLDSSDGMSFTKWSVYCSSPQGAKREFQKRLKKAVEILSREVVFDEHGQQIGEKVVAVFSPNDPDNSPASLLWTENEELFQVESSSLQNILKYRKDSRR